MVSNRNIDKLTALIAPPISPKCNAGDWDAVETELGVVLPAEYKEFISVYGQGTFCSVLDIESPFECSARKHWLNMAASYHDWEEVVPYATYPESPGLFPFGSYGDSDLLAWFTQGEPDAWPIIYHNHAEGYFPTQQGFVDFLIAVLSGQGPFPKEIWGDELLNHPRVFKPY